MEQFRKGWPHGLAAMAVSLLLASVGTVNMDGDSPQPEPRYPVGFDHPKVRVGSPTYPLDIIAGLTPDRQHLRIGVVNATVKAQPLSIALQGICAHAVGKVWRLVQ